MRTLQRDSVCIRNVACAFGEIPLFETNRLTYEGVKDTYITKKK